MSAIPYIDSYWVIPDRFLAGAYPGGTDEETTRKKIRSLIHAGISCIIDMTCVGDSFFPYKETLNLEASDLDAAIERVNFPIPDYDIPTIPLMQNTLDRVDNCLQNGQKVYVHCIGGIGRTGTVVACYLVRHGFTGAEALQELINLRQNTASWYRRSPESDLQIEFVNNWKKGQ